MGLASQYCPVCGGPFETFDLYDDTTGIGNEDDCWASVLSERDIQVTFLTINLIPLLKNQSGSRNIDLSAERDA